MSNGTAAAAAALVASIDALGQRMAVFDVELRARGNQELRGALTLSAAAKTFATLALGIRKEDAEGAAASVEASVTTAPVPRSKRRFDATIPEEPAPTLPSPKATSTAIASALTVDAASAAATVPIAVRAARAPLPPALGVVPSWQRARNAAAGVAAAAAGAAETAVAWALGAIASVAPLLHVQLAMLRDSDVEAFVLGVLPTYDSSTATVQEPGPDRGRRMRLTPWRGAPKWLDWLEHHPVHGRREAAADESFVVGGAATERTGSTVDMLLVIYLALFCKFSQDGGRTLSTSALRRLAKDAGIGSAAVARVRSPTAAQDKAWFKETIKLAAEGDPSAPCTSVLSGELKKLRKVALRPALMEFDHLHAQAVLDAKVAGDALDFSTFCALLELIARAVFPGTPFALLALNIRALLPLAKRNGVGKRIITSRMIKFSRDAITKGGNKKRLLKVFTAYETKATARNASSTKSRGIDIAAARDFAKDFKIVGPYLSRKEFNDCFHVCRREPGAGLGVGAVGGGGGGGESRADDVLLFDQYITMLARIALQKRKRRASMHITHDFSNKTTLTKKVNALLQTMEVCMSCVRVSICVSLPPHAHCSPGRHVFTHTLTNALSLAHSRLVLRNTGRTLCFQRAARVYRCGDHCVQTRHGAEHHTSIVCSSGTSTHFRCCGDEHHDDWVTSSYNKLRDSFHAA